MIEIFIVSRRRSGVVMLRASCGWFPSVLALARLVVRADARCGELAMSTEIWPVAARHSVARGCHDANCEIINEFLYFD
jgi:hypothetical protein